jgi:hypothetical protein
MDSTLSSWAAEEPVLSEGVVRAGVQWACPETVQVLCNLYLEMRCVQYMMQTWFDAIGADTKGRLRHSFSPSQE